MVKSERLDHAYARRGSCAFPRVGGMRRTDAGCNYGNCEGDETAEWVEGAYRTFRAERPPRLISAAGIFFRPTADAAASTGCDAMSLECRKKRRRRLKVISDYERYLAENPLDGEIRDVSELPGDRAEILEAIALEIVREDDDLRRMLLKARALMLSCFQEGVTCGQLCPDDGSGSSAAAGEEEFSPGPECMDFKAPNGSRREILNRRVQADMDGFRIRLQAAEGLRRQLPGKLVRRILG